MDDVGLEFAARQAGIAGVLQPFHAARCKIRRGAYAAHVGQHFEGNGRGFERHCRFAAVPAADREQFATDFPGIGIAPLDHVGRKRQGGAKGVDVIAGQHVCHDASLLAWFGRVNVVILRVMSKPREADLYGPVKAHLTRQGYAVKGEVGAADVVGRRGDDVVVVELKLGFSLALFHQGIERLAVTDEVYVAVPAGGKDKALRSNVKLARRLGLGVLTVRLRDGFVEALADPGPYAARKLKKKKKALLRAFDRLEGDPNEGGATRHGIVTGYRQDALKCARFLAVHGASKGAKVAEWTEVPGATRIMADDHYKWFTRVERGVYGLTAAGKAGLADWGDV
jgi:hypothetical protein